MGIDYGEIICTAVDEIVTRKLEGLQYDITKLCTVIDDTFSYQGKYIVSDGTARYEAYSENTSFKSGNSVLVIIPNGDYNMLKTITGRVAAADTAPFIYTSPMDTMIKITNNILDENIEEKGLLANEQDTSSIIGPIYTIKESGNFAGFTRLGITAEFRSWLNGLDVAEGAYGLKVLIYTDTLETPGSTKENVYELTFSSADMIGNPYQFESYFQQEKVFDISNINNIKQIEIYFYQNGQFKDGNGNKIPWQDEDALFGLSKKPNNLFTKDVKIYLGYETGAFTQETLMLYTDDSLTYHYTEMEDELKRKVALRWVHKIDDKNFELLDSSKLDDKYEVYWFRYHPGYENINQYAGKDWEEVYPLNEDSFIYVFKPDIEKQTEQIKAIGFIKEEIEGKDFITPYYSNLLIFENEEEVPDKKTWDASNALSIVCGDNSEGNYYIYNQNGKINNEGIGRGYKRYLKAMYQGAEISSSLGTLDWIKWWFPKDLTMLITTNDFYAENNGVKSDEVVKYKGVDYDVITRKAERDGAGDFQLPSAQQAYSIDNQWSFQKSNNTVRCQISIDGVIYEAIEELRFGKAGTNGTSITFLIEFAENQNALLAQAEKTIDVAARLYDAAGVQIPLNESVTWSWHKETKDKNYISLPENLSGNMITLTSNVDTVPADNYYILKAKYNNLEAYLPIPLKTEDATFIEGAKEIIYNHQGIPNYYNDVYTYYKWNEDNNTYEELICKWELIYDEKVEKDGKEVALSAGYIPQLKDSASRAGYKALSASQFYASGYNDKICVYCYQDDTIYWAQPILIMQSKYDFAMLNEWDGSLTIDEENGKILSTMLGAGRKNEDNTFSGVLIGDIQGGSKLNEANTLTGVYGLHEGVVSYALKEDGTATFGKPGNGQILIDGNKSTIQSASYNTSTQGTSIDLDEGIVDIKFDPGRILLQPKDPYLYIRSVNNTPLMQIGDEDNYLQSSNFKATNGSKLNLSDGTLEIRSAKSQFLISGKGSPYFKMGIPLDDNDAAYANSLFYLDDNDYYLKSKSYQDNSYIKVNGYNTYKQASSAVLTKSGLPSISDIVAISPNGDVYAVSGTGTSLTLGNKYTFQATTGTNIGTEDNEVYNSQTPEQVKQSYIALLTPNLQSTQTTKGFKLDLNNSLIKGYDLYLKGTNASNNKTFLLDSSDPEVPFQIGDSFKVSWDGVLTCKNINTLNNDGRNDYAISIGNNFYVTKGGSAGGSAPGLSCGYATNASNVQNISGAYGGQTKEGFLAVYIAGKIYSLSGVGAGTINMIIDEISNLQASISLHDKRLDNLAERIAKQESATTMTNHYHRLTNSTTLTGEVYK